MSALVTKLSQAPRFKFRGLFAILFAAELREAMALTQRDEGALLWGL